MAEIVNLRREKKRRARDDASREAAENRAKFGRTGAERAVVALETARGERVLNAARLERDGEDKA